MALAPAATAYRSSGLREILRTQVGSGAHGVAIQGRDDRDEMGVFIEPRDRVYGLEPPLDTYVFRTQPEGARSGPGDLDLVVYSLRHFLRLAVKGNPTVLTPLFVPTSDVMICDEIGDQLRDLRRAFLSQQALERFLGYMHGQHERMLGRGRQSRVPNRPELIEAYGWDTKYGAHALRLALQAHEIATTGNMELPMAAGPQHLIRAVKLGQHSRDEVSDQITALETEIRTMLHEGRTVLPERPDVDLINEWSMQAHEQAWKAARDRALGVWV